VDLSRTFRQTGLSTGAKLELVQASRSPSVVSVALQIPENEVGGVPGGRLTDKIPSDTTLWRILRKFESTEGKNFNFTARGVASVENGASGSGQILYEMPVLNVMGRDIATFGDLQKTLAQLGFNSGSCLIRLNFKKTEQPLLEAQAEIGQYFKEEEPAELEKNGAEAGIPEVDSTTNGIARIPSQEPVPSQDVEMSEASHDISQDPTSHPERAGEELQATPVTPSKRPAPEATPEPKKEEEFLGVNQRPISVFSPPSSNTPKAALLPHSESDFDLTIQQAKAHQKHLETKSQNKKLLSDAETEQHEKELAAKLARINEVKIMVRFSDQSRIQLKFTAEDTGAHLYSEVVSAMAAETETFKLVWTNKGVQTVPRNEKKLIQDLGFQGSVLVNFVWGDDVSDAARKSPVLKPEYREKMQALPVPQTSTVQPEPKPEAGPSTADKGKEKEGSSTGGKPKGIPKWFKGLQKK
jgi:tether containing UBX domain for GLUT4